MPRLSIYLLDFHKEKIDRIAKACNTTPTTIARVALRQMPEEYLTQLVQAYKEQENEKV